MRFVLLYWITTVFFIGSAYAGAGKHRHHDVHVHGSGELNIVQEGRMLMIDLNLPAMNVVGFEHKPKSQKQKQALQSAKKSLNNGGELFVPTAAAACQLQSVDVDSALLEIEHHEEHHPHHQHEDEGESEHAEFSVIYEFSCKKVAQLRDVKVNLFNRFPSTEYLKAQVITESKQTGMKLSQKNSVITLK